MKSRFSSHFFFPVFLCANILVLAYEWMFPNAFATDVLVRIAHAPIFILNTFIDAVFHLDTTGHNVLFTSDIPMSLQTIIFFIFICTLIGSIGFLASIGLLIDYLRKKYAH